MRSSPEIPSSNHLSNTHRLARVFAHTTNSYKMFWLKALLKQMVRSGSLRLDDLLVDMIATAWPPVLQFRLSLGVQDQLQECVRYCQQESGLRYDSPLPEVRAFLSSRSDLIEMSRSLERYVPYRFLTPWLSSQLRGMPDQQKNDAIRILSRESQLTQDPTPYYFSEADEQIIELNPEWRHFLQVNTGVVGAFVDYHLGYYLQSRNPNVPGVLDKLYAPQRRSLTPARKFWDYVRSKLAEQGEVETFRDIYAGVVLQQDYALDHFCPWSFVAHDQIWNLVPAVPNINSSKSDHLPDLDYYLPRMASLQWRALQFVERFPKFAEEFVNCYRVDLHSLRQMDQRTLLEKMQSVFVPLFVVARNQGFQDGWRYSNTARA